MQDPDPARRTLRSRIFRPQAPRRGPPAPQAGSTQHRPGSAPPPAGTLLGRHRLFVALLLGTVGIAAGTLYGALAADGLTVGEAVLLGLFSLLLTWVGSGFWFAVFGAVVGTRPPPERPEPDPCGADAEAARTAIVVPIYQEDAALVFARLCTMYRSLVRLDRLESFEFFVLSDSREPEAWLLEQRAWLAACRELDAFGRLFYRRRARNEGRKSGNIESFCRAWGARYDYMIVLDADSLIDGETLVEMVRRMAAEPGLGLLQTRPKSINGESLFARLQQFAGSVYGDLMTRGLAYLQATSGTYWGHNAIIRMRAFAEHCALPELPGREPLGGPILSHDFVEAALLLRAGWRVRMDPDLAGSYEEGPPSLAEHAVRDRRWCQGNLQHIALLFARGLHPLSRVNFLIGIMSYLSGPIWLLFLGLSIYEVTAGSQLAFWLREVEYRIPMLAVLGLTGLLLFGPKLLSLAFVLADSKCRERHGGALRVALGVSLEALFATVTAPIMMMLHTRFVLSILAGWSSGWGAQRRSASGTPWRDALRMHWPETAAGLGLALLVQMQVPQLFWWLSPVVAGLSLSVPISVLTSRLGWGAAARRVGLFLVPEEAGGREAVAAGSRTVPQDRHSPSGAGDPLTEMLRDPVLCAVHLALLPEDLRRPSLEIAAHLAGRSLPALSSLSAPERRALLADPALVRSLHFRLFREEYAAAG